MAPFAAPSFEAIGPWNPNSKVALACSGGADSTFLALQWLDFAKKLGAQAPKAVVWVVDHGHRQGTVEEAKQASELYSDLGLEVRVLTAPTQRLGPKGEAGLRQLRYRLFAKAAAEQKVSILLTAHHADDQAETVLLRILRGSGLRGLAGIPLRRRLTEFGMPEVEVRRPLLMCRRAAIREFLTAKGQNWIEDPTNFDSEAAARNHLRNEVLPLLAESTQADPIPSLVKLAEEAQSWRAWVEAGFQEEGQGWYADWELLPGVLRRAGIADLLQRNGHPVSRGRVADLEGCLLRNRSASVDEKNRMSLAGGCLRILKRMDPQARRKT